jgi:hypothetical protein
MKKFFTLILILILGIIIAGIYGIVHDQITYSVSHEYYTKFKFYQFGLMDIGNEAIFPNPRIEVSIVGIMATWWMGIPIGLILGLVGLIHINSKEMFIITIKAFLVTLVIALITGLIGLAYGEFILGNETKENFKYWYFPENLIDFRNFVAVGSMHNFSYLGGLFGLIGGVLFSIRRKTKYETAAANTR